jgi:hypothetical protein
MKNKTLLSAMEQVKDENYQIDLVCCLGFGSFVAEYTQTSINLKKSTSEAALVFFFLNLLQMLGDVGTVCAIERALSNIEPTYNQKNEASTGHTTLRSRLQSDEKYKDYFLDSFLSGSYGRDTAIRPIKDVDIIIIADYSEILWEPKTSLYHIKGILSKYYENVTVQSRSNHVLSARAS